MEQGRLKHLTQMSLDCDLVRKLDFSDLVRDLAAKKSKKVVILSKSVKLMLMRRIYMTPI